tara:strand:+ start:527 stop:1240 length:714 start_codon:yes stop_codon:yes gene_type:complete
MQIQRKDGRKFNEIRPIKVDWDPMGFALSSLIIHTGSTSVLCSVSIQDSVPKWLKGEGRGWLSAQYRLLPASTPTRQERELLKISGRTQEIQRLISRTLRASLDMEALGEKTLLVDCDVIQADAGTRTASITGSWMALKKAFSILNDKGIVSKNALPRQVAAVSVGLLEGQPFIDLDYIEDSSADVDFNVVMDSDGRFLELQGTAERKSFTKLQLDNLLSIADKGLRHIHTLQKDLS